MEHKIKQLANILTDGKISVLERNIGVSSSRLDKIVKRDSKIGLDIVKAIVEKYPMVNEKWFDNDDEIMFISEESVPYYKKRLEKKNSDSNNAAPLIPVKAQAGYTRAYDQTDFLDTMEKYALPPGITRHGSTWAYWEIEGDSMEPNFYNKDIILTSQVHPMDWNSDGMRNFYTYVVVTDDSVYIKRVFLKDENTWVMISENEDNGHPQFPINPKDVKEVWVFRRHISSRAPASRQFKIKI